ncbi:MAG: LCP family protein [Clostridiales bacterium]|nr:LCP family protein [Clostridiales bacterium]
MKNIFTKKNKQFKYESKMRMFIKTFVMTFTLILIVVTPVLATVTKIGDLNPGGREAPVIEEELDFLISSDSPFFDAFTYSKRVNILALGVNENEGLTDTIMLASLDIENKHLDLIWIPRDTYYYREGYKSSDLAQFKINAAYRKNPLNSAKAVSEVLMGIPINYYAVLSYDGVARIVDSMRGVPMDIPFHMKYDDPLDKPPLHVNIPKGEQVLDGDHAIQFLRYRSGYADADLGRIKAQQQFMKNAFKQCLSFELPNIARTVFNNVTSDINLRTALYLAGKAVGISSDDITTYMMPVGKVDHYVHPDVEKISEMLEEIYSIGQHAEEEAEEGEGSEAH